MRLGLQTAAEIMGNFVVLNMCYTCVTLWISVYSPMNSLGF